MIDFNAPPLKNVIEILLLDMNTRKNILLDGKELLKKNLPEIKPRAQKSHDEKIFRTRTQAEVFTPCRVVKFMVDAIDDGKIDSRWLEIACGEAPFITTRYDAETGEDIPLDNRVGILDRKLRAMPHAENKFSWAKRALQSVYGYEIQGDSLLIARANILLTVADFLGEIPDNDLAEFADIISWNFFQFDALNPPKVQGSLFDAPPVPQIIDWQAGRKFFFWRYDIKKFDFVISNPPYNEETENTSDKPVYNYFMDAAKKISDKAAFITPARFLFDADGTPKDFKIGMPSTNISVSGRNKACLKKSSRSPLVTTSSP
ncbi:MAG: Eco57I restriction-modification methylase domain-containing protein [Selenomonadaceae bacterium]|nr:Eco57I restriction-modification methylase domain-containing protein [Selenomonadaceae bacterium]